MGILKSALQILVVVGPIIIELIDSSKSRK